MTRYTWLYLLLSFLNVHAWAQRKAVFIIVDGIPADVIEKLKPPVLQEIAGATGYTRAYVGGIKGGYSESPTVSAVGYNHVLTGTWTNKHNVRDNDIKDPNYHYWNVFRIASRARPGITTGIFSTWLYNRTKLVGDGIPAAGSLHIDYAFDGYENDTVRFPHGKDIKYISDIDELVATEAARIISTKAPDLSWVYLEYTDDTGHAFGDSPQFDEAIRVTDERIGKIWKAVQVRQKEHGEEWLVIITTDHGRTAKDGKGHGGQSDRERTTWMVTNAKDANAHFRTDPGAVDIAPTLLRHLDIAIPDDVKMEMDGIPLIGNVSIDNLKAIRTGRGLSLTWRRLPGATGKADLYLARTNLFRNGQRDDYRKIATVNIEDQGTIVPMSSAPASEPGAPASIYKWVLKANDNWVNTWWVGH
ncbi:MAG TPA: alkaline phosphatase family protein [Chryseolinea sp.]|nr:alkaline phosphatase family protein [Chryseolinea sp.]